MALFFGARCFREGLSRGLGAVVHGQEGHDISGALPSCKFPSESANEASNGHGSLIRRTSGMPGTISTRSRKCIKGSCMLCMHVLYIIHIRLVAIDQTAHYIAGARVSACLIVRV